MWAQADVPANLDAVMPRALLASTLHTAACLAAASVRRPPAACTGAATGHASLDFFTHIMARPGEHVEGSVNWKPGA